MIVHRTSYLAQIGTIPVYLLQLCEDTSLFCTQLLQYNFGVDRQLAFHPNIIEYLIKIINELLKIMQPLKCKEHKPTLIELHPFVAFRCTLHVNDTFCPYAGNIFALKHWTTKK
jgi:hypothetical protein